MILARFCRVREQHAHPSFRLDAGVGDVTVRFIAFFSTLHGGSQANRSYPPKAFGYIKSYVASRIIRKGNSWQRA